MKTLMLFIFIPLLSFAAAAPKGCNDAELLSFAKLHPNEMSLEIESQSFTAQGLANAMAAMPQLSALTLENAIQLRDEDFAILAPYFQRLATLKLIAAKALSNQGLISIAPYLLNISDLSLARCNHVKPYGLAVFFKNLPKLQRCDLYACIQADTTTLVTLANYCPKLESLKLGLQDYIEDAAFKSLATMPALRSLSIGTLPALTDNGLLALIASPSLCNLRYETSKMISDKVEASFCEKRPDVTLDIYHLYNSARNCSSERTRTPSRSASSSLEPASAPAKT